MNGPGPSDRSWSDGAVAQIAADQRRSADTHLIRLDLPALSAGPDGVDIYMKDESTHPTGSLKHRLARSLFLYGLCNGLIREGAAVVEASSGSTAVSEAYFARMIGVPFYAVMPRSTSPEKIAAIEHQGGICHFVDSPSAIYAEAEALARRLGGHYLDQFTFAERATDWRGNNNIAESIFEQMAAERHPVPRWIVMGAGTGGTSATIGRYIRYRGLPTRLSVVDVEFSAFFDGYRNRDGHAVSDRGSRIEGVGRPRIEPSFLPAVIDHMAKLPDAASLAAMRVLSRRMGRAVGGSTGANFLGLCLMADRMRRDGGGAIVSLICDSGERYRHSYHAPDWLTAQGFDTAATEAAIERFLDGGPLALEVAEAWGAGDAATP
ncbi:PLP-dependent cysteine synthase family protein [Marinibaculum pumilum]|uniref:L-cysteine desulfhydrase Cds1 n=1 Tax=Marinibaculum pumilum TaxID=1766165 RepID=A0ABV7LA54_9PROT